MWSVLKNLKKNFAIKRSRKSVPFFIYSDHRVLDQEQSSSVQGSIRRPRKEYDFILDSNQGQVEIQIKVGENIFLGAFEKGRLKK